ncbi:hypothetical protein GOP47_0026798 [Adiantum capillus-veneris]|nr:hypothetical protein GOP47_0026798 [Adiantum capillus-veneris]
MRSLEEDCFVADTTLPPVEGYVDKENINLSSNKQPMQRSRSQSDQARIIDLLQVPMSEAKNAKKDEISKAREQKKVEKEKRRLQSLVEIEARKQRQEEAAQAKRSKKDWEAQQLVFEKRMRAILWEGGSLEGLILNPLHVDHPYHANPRRRQMEKLQRSPQQTTRSIRGITTSMRV